MMKKCIGLLSGFILSICLTTEIKATLTQEQVDEIVNKKVIKAYELINKNWNYLYFIDDGAHYYVDTNSEFLEFSNEESIFSLKIIDPNFDIIKALTELLAQKAYLECAIASRLVQILCLLELLGEEKFNKWLLTLQDTKDIDCSSDLFFHMIPIFFMIEATDLGFTYITNAALYRDIKKYDNGKGYNGYLFSDETFISFDPIHFKTAKSIEEVQCILFSNLMNDRNITDQERYLELKSNYENDFDKFRKNFLDEKQKSIKIRKFSADKINYFIETGKL